MDIEEGAGNQAAAGPNLVHFVRKLRSIKPDIIIGQPTYGYPQVEAANDVINESWDTNGNLRNVVDSIGKKNSSNCIFHELNSARPSQFDELFSNWNSS